MPAPFDLTAWDFELPVDRIATYPASTRSGSRLMRVHRNAPTLSHHRFTDLADQLRPGDLVVANDARVMACRLKGTRPTGGAVELLLLSPGPGVIPALARPARKLNVGMIVDLGEGHGATVRRAADNGIVHVELSADAAEIMRRQGALPLPPYLGREAEPVDDERYQTIFAGPLGAAAAPTAGLHFDDDVMASLRHRGVRFATVTLFVGLGTFRPLRDDDVERGELHEEAFAVPEATVEAIAATRQQGGRVIAVGTTVARTLETATPLGALLPQAGAGTTRLFIRPPYTFRSLDGLVTNFHLPRSSLLMLVASLITRERLLKAYDEALQQGYRFYSYGDAMLLL